MFSIKRSHVSAAYFQAIQKIVAELFQVKNGRPQKQMEHGKRK
jgi:hypothetical protein